MRSLSLALLVSTLVAACGDGSPSFEPGKVDLDALPHANAGCEAPSAAALAPGAAMLPGRICDDCHKKDSEATSVFTAAGTVYGTREGACGEGGLEGVTVEILDMDGAVQATLTTNAAGNFSTTQSIRLPMRVRLVKDDKEAVMTSAMESASCATCHKKDPESGAPGRVYLE